MSTKHRWPSVAPAPSSQTLQRLLDAANNAAPHGDFGMAIDPQSHAPVLEGGAAEWSEVIAAGHAAAAAWVLERPDESTDLVVDADAPDLAAPPNGEEASAIPAAGAAPAARVAALPSSAEAVVIGGGIVGLAIADALTQRGLRPLVVEASGSLGSGTTHWNNGMVHPGHDPKPGTLKAQLNIRGNALWAALARRIGLPFTRSASLVVAHTEAEATALQEFLRRAHGNGVPGASMVDGAEARRLEPRLNPEIQAALLTPSTAMIDAVQATRLLAVALRRAGGQTALNARVTHIDTQDGEVVGVITTAGPVETRIVINAAGMAADLVAATTGQRRYSLHARRGALVLLDPGAEDRYPLSVGPVPGQYSKGGGMTARPDGMTTAGPSAVEQRSRTALPATQAEVDALLAVGERIYPDFPLGAAVAIGSEVRPVSYSEDFVISLAPAVKGLVDAAGTQSPGIAAAPAIGERVAQLLAPTGLMPVGRTTHV